MKLTNYKITPMTFIQEVAPALLPSFKLMVHNLTKQELEYEDLSTINIKRLHCIALERLMGLQPDMHQDYYMYGDHNYQAMGAEAFNYLLNKLVEEHKASTV
jgi:hypothetical protein